MKYPRTRQAFPLNGCVKYLPGFLFFLFLRLCQFRYKKRVYRQSNLDEKQLAKLHTKVSKDWLCGPLVFISASSSSEIRGALGQRVLLPVRC